MEPIGIVVDWLKTNSGKIILLIVVALLAAVIDKALTRIVSRVLDRSQVPNASISSIFCARWCGRWLWALCCSRCSALIRPRFHRARHWWSCGVARYERYDREHHRRFRSDAWPCNPAGDLVNVAGTDGVVEDINWRQTVVRTRSGDMMVIPNSVLNTAALTKLTPVSEGMATLEFTAKASGDPSAISQDILDRVTKATADVALEGQPPLVKFTGFSPYGMTGQVLVFAREACCPPP